MVIHCTGDRLTPVRQGRYLASHIPGAKFVEVDSADHLYWIESGDRIADEIEEFVTGHRSSVPADRVLATVLFTDIVDSTALASRIGDRRWRVLLDEHDRLLRREVDRHGGRYVESTGDGALATFNGPSRAIDCALALCEAVRLLGLDIRAGLHTGEVEVRAENIGGIAVHVAARVTALAGPAEVLASRTVRDLVAGSSTRFHDHGVHSLKGISEDWHLYRVTSGQ
jgi:class 3 adenylate cyclase